MSRTGPLSARRMYMFVRGAAGERAREACAWSLLAVCEPRLYAADRGDNHSAPTRSVISGSLSDLEGARFVTGAWKRVDRFRACTNVDENVTELACVCEQIGIPKQVLRGLHVRASRPASRGFAYM